MGKKIDKAFSFLNPRPTIQTSHSAASKPSHAVAPVDTHVVESRPVQTSAAEPADAPRPAAPSPESSATPKKATKLSVAEHLEGLDEALQSARHAGELAPTLEPALEVLSGANRELLSQDHVKEAITEVVGDALRTQDIPQEVHDKVAEVVTTLAPHLPTSFTDLPPDVTRKIMLSLSTAQLSLLGGANREVRAMTHALLGERVPQMSHAERAFLPAVLRDTDDLRVVDIMESLTRHHARIDGLTLYDGRLVVKIYHDKVAPGVRFLTEARLARAPAPEREAAEAALFEIVGRVTYASLYGGLDDRHLPRAVLHDCPPFLRDFLVNPSKWDRGDFFSQGPTGSAYRARFPTWIPIDANNMLRALPTWLEVVENDSATNRGVYHLSPQDRMSLFFALQRTTEGHSPVTERIDLHFRLSSKRFKAQDYWDAKAKFPSITLHWDDSVKR